MMTLVYSSVTVSHYSVTVSRHAQYHDPSFLILMLIYTLYKVCFIRKLYLIKREIVSSSSLERLL